ncbi:MAG: DUF2264 domain-containing protein [Oscillospiraceae bacterium]|nr:DUF2264 domain-containing protein [Oscillospiraceae bacterium]
MNHRTDWLNAMLKIAEPVLTALHNRQLKQVMPMQQGAGETAYLEALGRTLAGIAPWLEQAGSTPQEEQLRQRYCALARSAIAAGTDPTSPDYLCFSAQQSIVDAAFLAHAIIRAPRELFAALPAQDKAHVIAALKATRVGRAPHFNNWLLFSAMIETALLVMDEPDWDMMRVDYALRQHEQWYVGDGAYADGPAFHWDYYNSFVIHPMLLDITRTVEPQNPQWQGMHARMLPRAQRYAAVLERMISPEGTYPPIGRSLCYRFGAFQALAQLAQQEQLPPQLPPEQVRCALSAVLQRFMARDDALFDAEGWLKLGMLGDQPGLGESYITTGSLYLCTAVFLPLALPETHCFWAGAPQAWTAKKIWAGEDLPADGALYD